MIDYTIFYRQSVTLDELASRYWDTVVSAYNGSERVHAVFQAWNAGHKHWIMHKEYGFAENEWPTNGTVYAPGSSDEAEFLREYLDASSQDLLSGSLCIDITGFMRPHLMLLVFLLKRIGIPTFDAVYSEPIRYADSERTVFADGPVNEVRQVAGFEGVHAPGNESADLLIIGAGFDARLVRLVVDAKSHARKRLMYGLPSLQADMYQQGRLNIGKSSESIGPPVDNNLMFAPANNPFVTAQVLSDAVREEAGSSTGISNLYLSPLGTKPQVLGFALFYLRECVGKATSIIFPFASRYSRETSKGVSKVSIYSVEIS